jgi:hypothetical protein
MKYGICNWIIGDEDPETIAASLAKVVFDGILRAAYPMSTSEAEPASAIPVAGHRLFLVSHP